jgi:cysteine desulfurase/selenocysteine lyase
MPTPPATGDEVGLPAWLPDEATMNRLAGEFFSALPGGTAALPGAADEPGVPAVGGPVPAGLPAADAPPGVPRAGVSPPSGPPPTSAPTAIGTTTAGIGLPFLPTLAPVAEPVSGPYYFLSGAPTYPPAAPALPGFGQFEQPSLAAPPAPALSRSGFYFLDDGPATVPPLPLDPHPAFDVHAVRRDFPILSELVNGRPLIWLDNAATTQKPQAVIDRLVSFYTHENSNIHRAAHELASRATDAYESARDTVARFLGAGSADEIVFVRGTTEAINLVAQTWGRRHVREGDEIIISHLEHHANIVPWQMLAKETGAVIKVIPVDDAGQLLLDGYTALLSDRTKLVAVTHVSNALGTVTPVEQIVELGHRAGATVLIDGAQSVPHTPINLQEMAADFFVFSGHKVLGPTGIGVLYGREEVLADTPPWQGGGNMITDVTLERSLYKLPPDRFEAGTANIADAAGLATALDYVERIGMPTIASYEHSLLEYATAGLRGIPGLRLVGTAAEKASVVSFVLAGYTPEEVGSALNEEGIAVRGGHHCAQPILRRLGLEATVRPSLAFYNTCDEIDTLVAAVHRLALRSGHST